MLDLTDHLLRKSYSLSLNEYAVLCEIYYLSHNEKFNGWCIKSKVNIAKTLDLTDRTVFRAIEVLIEKELIKKNDRGDLRPTDKWTSTLAERHNLAFGVKTDEETIQSASGDFLQQTTTQGTYDKMSYPMTNSQNEPRQNVIPPMTKCHTNNNIKYKQDNNILPKGNISELEEAELLEEKEFGNPEINRILKTLKERIGIEAFADYQNERNFALHLIRLGRKLGGQEFSRRLDIIVNDGFKRKNCNRIRYLYQELKGFIETKKPIPSF